MGKSWDSTGIAYNVDMWKECLRVLKPGGYLLSFGGTRTYHRMACAIEDAGFEIRDQIQWIYGSGFPKSMDVSKAIDKQAGVERTEGQRAWRGGQRASGIMGDNLGTQTLVKFDTPATEDAKKWQGWGTALKPANEPICMARKPLSEKTVAENVLKWGAGGINIDGCRIEYTVDNPPIPQLAQGKTTINSDNGMYGGSSYNESKTKCAIGGSLSGRFPANLILDEYAAEILDEQSGTVSYGNKSGGYRYSGNEYEVEGFVKSCKPKAPSNYGDTGGASRFFYCAKAAKKEKGNGNNHPTVKPLKLMEYLVKLVTPPNGICIDPFAGSGTTAVAALTLDKRFIGIEMDSTYCGIIVNRIQDIDKKYA